MSCINFLTDNTTPLVLDTSVFINLHACTFGEEILSAIPNNIWVPDNVNQELLHETSRINGGHQFMQSLISQRKVRLIELDCNALKIFEKLVPTIDDGEAATIAIAISQGYLPVIDDGKGRSLAVKYIPDKPPAWSLDLFLHPGVRDALSSEDYINALFLALSKGRMRINEALCDKVVGIIGIEYALQCTSLPGYKGRKEAWLEQLSGE